MLKGHNLPCQECLIFHLPLGFSHSLNMCALWDFTCQPPAPDTSPGHLPAPSHPSVVCIDEDPSTGSSPTLCLDPQGTLSFPLKSIALQLASFHT